MVEAQEPHRHDRSNNDAGKSRGRATAASATGGRGQTGHRCCFQQKRRILLEDSSLELLELRAGLEAELGKISSRALIRGERLGLAARSVEGEHERRATSLSHRLRASETLELGNELRVT